MSLIKIFGSRPELTPAESMMATIKKQGGEFHFDVTFSDGGWLAKCREFPQIMTWGDGEPSAQEISETTMEAIKSAFSIPSDLDKNLKFNKIADTG